MNQTPVSPATTCSSLRLSLFPDHILTPSHPATILSPLSMHIHPLDLAIVIVYLLGVTALGMRFRRKQRDLPQIAKGDRNAIARDYFLGGRTAPWWALAFSIVATETSTLTIIGTPAIAYGGNLTFLQLVFGYLIGRLLIVVLLLPGYFRGDFFTAYALIEKRFGQRMRAVAASTFLITRAIAEGVRVSAIALVLSVLLGTSEHLSVVIVIALTLLYTLEGGMKAVIWTDVAQLFIYLAGSTATFFVLLHRIPGGWNEVVQIAATHGHKLQLFDFSFHLATKYTFWSGLIGGAFLTMASHGTDQTIVQRLLAARNQRDSRRAPWPAALSSSFNFLSSCSSGFFSTFSPSTLLCSLPANAPTASCRFFFFAKCPPASRDCCSPPSSPWPCPTPAAR